MLRRVILAGLSTCAHALKSVFCQSVRRYIVRALGLLLALGCVVVGDSQFRAAAQVSPLVRILLADPTDCWHLEGDPRAHPGPYWLTYIDNINRPSAVEPQATSDPRDVDHTTITIKGVKGLVLTLQYVPCPPPPPRAAKSPEPVKLYNVGTLRKRPTEPLPPTEFPFGPNGPFETASFEFSGYGGSVAASSFGSDFNPNVWGGRAVARMPIGQFRLQTDIQGERTNDYSSIAGHRSYFAGGVHADWMWAPNTEIGAFGGFQDATPTFQEPTSTNYFVGLEGRQFFGPAMVGVQFGRFDVTNGPGTLTDAWFVEGRAKFSLGEAFRTPALKYTILGGNLGYGSGTASAVSTRAQTTYWGLGLTQGIANTPVRLSLTFDHFENRVDGLGLVWKENKLMGGMKILFPSTDVTRGLIEPTVPLPYILGTVMTF